MNTAVVWEPVLEVDPVEEIRLRTWARHNYAPLDERDSEWHPVILDEMRQKDLEQNQYRY
ncbi:hypothetical protein [Planctomicrobium sp. SH664]|uniref:hypothetical protein n=1 Tax=Planctomicrobium sp. SH664 TaxID=3448125 RepID=UPI003F5C334A